MKKYIIIVSILVGCLCFLLVRKITDLDKKNSQKKNVEKFFYSSLKGRKLIFNLNNKQNTFFIYFNSECEFCQMEARDILENRELINDYELYFISEEEIDDIEKFSKKWKLNNIKNIHFIKDNNNSFKNKFNIKNIPSIVFYTKNDIFFYKGSYSIKFILNEVNKKNNQ